VPAVHSIQKNAYHMKRVDFGVGNPPQHSTSMTNTQELISRLRRTTTKQALPLDFSAYIVSKEEPYSLMELSSTESLPELPVGRSHIVRSHTSAIAGGDLEGEALAIEVGVALPILSPVA